MATISDICVFLSCSAQRIAIFKDNVEGEVSGSASSRQKLKPICATRWVERHDSIIIFVTLLPAVVSTFEELQQENKQVEVATKAATLLNFAQKCTFLIAALVMQHTSGIILPVSKLLQKKELDIFAVIELIDVTGKFAWNNSSLYRKQTCWKDLKYETAGRKLEDCNQSKLIIGQLTWLKTTILGHYPQVPPVKTSLNVSRSHKTIS